MSADKFLSGLGKNMSALTKLILSSVKGEPAIKPQKPSAPDESDYATGIYFKYTGSFSEGMNPVIDYFEPQTFDSAIMKALKNISMSEADRFFYDGCRYLLLGLKRKAIEHFYKAIDKSPQMSDAYFMLGVLEAGAEKKLTPRECFHKALILNVNLGKSLKKIFPTFRLLIPVTDNIAFAFYADFIGVNILQALSARKTGSDESVKIMRQTLDLMPGNNTVIFFYALFLYEKGRREKAVSVLKSVLPGAPAFELNYLLMAKMLYDSGEYGVALEVLNKGASSQLLDPQLKEDYKLLISDCEMMAKGREPLKKELILFKRLGVSVRGSRRRILPQENPDSLEYIDLQGIGETAIKRRLLQKGSGMLHPVSDNLTIGRGSECDIRIEDDPLVENEHALITIEEGRIFIEDLSSDTGTFVNRFRIQHKMNINREDTISIGDTEFVVK